MSASFSNYWFDNPAEDVVDEVVLWRQLSGEDIDEGDPDVIAETMAQLALARRDVLRSIRLASDGRIRVVRAIDVAEEDIDDFERKGLGVCWAFDPRGAYAYDGRRRGLDLVVEAAVDPDDVVWPAVFAMWSSGEGEARLHPEASVLVERVVVRDRGEIRDDLAGREVELQVSRRAAAPGV